MNKHREKLPLQYNPVHILGRLKGLILHHSSLNLAKLAVSPSRKSPCKCGIWDVSSACPLSFHQPQPFRKIKSLMSLRIKTDWLSPPHFQTEIWHFLTNVLVGYNVASSIPGIKCLGCNTEIYNWTVTGDKKFSIPSGCCASLVPGQGGPGTAPPTERWNVERKDTFHFLWGRWSSWFFNVWKERQTNAQRGTKARKRSCPIL